MALWHSVLAMVYSVSEGLNCSDLAISASTYGHRMTITTLPCTSTWELST
jgi:hypothetical protein